MKKQTTQVRKLLEEIKLKFQSDTFTRKDCQVYDSKIMEIAKNLDKNLPVEVYENLKILINSIRFEIIQFSGHFDNTSRAFDNILENISNNFLLTKQLLKELRK